MDSVPWLTLKCCSSRAVGWEQVQIESFVVVISCDLSNKALFGRSVVRAGLANPHQTFPAIYTRNAIECSAVRADMDHATDRPSRGAKVCKPVGTVGLFGQFAYTSTKSLHGFGCRAWRSRRRLSCWSPRLLWLPLTRNGTAGVG